MHNNEVCRGNQDLLGFWLSAYFSVIPTGDSAHARTTMREIYL
jgi:hypothetical protein